MTGYLFDPIEFTDPGIALDLVELKKMLEGVEK